MPALPPPRPPAPCGHPRARLTQAIALLAAALLAALVAGCGTSASVARLPPVPAGRVGPESMVTSGSEIIYNTAGTIAALKALGVDRVHVPLYWNALAPDPASAQRPSFDAENPAAYPAGSGTYPTLGWAPYDTIVRDLRAAHIGIDLDITSPPPRWAAGRGAPSPATQTEWRPSAGDFGQFVHAVAVRYSGHYVPAGAGKPLPRVDFWSVWNEPNLGINLAPEAVDHSQVEVAPRYYRAFVDAAWTAFGATGHGHDTILIGELAPAGSTLGAGPGKFNSMAPLRFLRALYCVDAAYKPLTATAAAQRGCPTTASASAHFAEQHPALFHASGYADHPYSQGLAPPAVTPDEPDFAELGEIGRLATALDRLQRAYSSSTRFPIWSTEFGYQTKPPDPEPGSVSPATAAYYMNWAEYLTWLNPRLRSYDQYLLMDPGPPYAFATGLESQSGVPKPGYFAFRMPLYLPVTSTIKGHPLDVWGAVRPAPDAAHSTHRRQTARVEFRSGGSGSWHTVRHVAITDPHGYFELRQTFPGSGQVRVAWTRPSGAQMFSRTVLITLH